MKAIYLTKYGNSDKAFEIRDIDIPTPGATEVVIKAAYSGINFADVVARRGLYPDAPKNPALLGYDVAGTIHTVGSEVKDLKVGQRVTALTRFGGYAEYAVTMQEAVAVIPDEMDLAESTALATQGCTAYYCAIESVTLNEGDKVLVQAAAGGVGIMLTQIAKHHGCTVYGTASTKKQDFLKTNKVDYPIDYTSTNFYNHIKKDLKHEGVDVVFDSIGGKAYKRGMKLLVPSGRMVNFGAADQINGNKTNVFRSVGVVLGFGIFSPLQLLMSSKAAIGVNMLRVADQRPHVFQKVLKETISLAEKGILKPVIAKNLTTKTSQMLMTL